MVGIDHPSAPNPTPSFVLVHEIIIIDGEDDDSLLIWRLQARCHMDDARGSYVQHRLIPGCADPITARPDCDIAMRPVVIDESRDG
jgi:hypothetical protein